MEGKLANPSESTQAIKRLSSQISPRSEFDISLPIDYDKITMPPCLTEEHQQKAFLEIIKMTREYEENHGLSLYQKYYIYYADAENHCLVRYLRARDFDVNKSFNLLKHSLEWIESYKPHMISATKIDHEGSTGKMFVHGLDKFGRPVVYLVPSRENTYDNVANIELLVYTLWTAVDRMDNGHTQMVWICDYSGYSMKNAPSLSVCKQTVEILSSHFPERLGVALIMNPPRVFSWFWKLISPFIPAATKEKIKFCNTSDKKEMMKFLEPYFTPDQVLKDFGGELEIDFANVWKHDKVLDNARLKKISALCDTSSLFANVE